MKRNSLKQKQHFRPAQVSLVDPGRKSLTGYHPFDDSPGAVLDGPPMKQRHPLHGASRDGPPAGHDAGGTRWAQGVGENGYIDGWFGFGCTLPFQLPSGNHP